MIKISIILSVFLMSTLIKAEDKSHQHGHHGHSKNLGAHEHGAIKLEIGVIGKIIELDLDGPAESFLGFEYTPKSKKEKNTFKEAETLWTKDLLTKLFIFDKKLECSSSEASFIQDFKSGVHSNIEAKAKIICNKDLLSQSLLVSVKKYFPHVKKLSIDVVGSETKSYNSRAIEEIKL